MEIMEVTKTPTDIPFLDILAAVILSCDTDEVDGILHTIFTTRTCQTAVTLNNVLH